MTSYVSIIISIFFFHCSQGNFAWIYIPEVCVDSATGLAVASQFLNLTLISLTFEFMINSAMQVHGTIWYFAGFNFLGFIFFLVVVKETRGLSDLEKKTLYSPKGSILAEPAETSSIEPE